MDSEQPPAVSTMGVLRWFGLTAAVATGYLALGLLGLALALPPGFVSAIWPAAGFAFAVGIIGGARRTWVGLLMGSLATNATVGGGFHPDTVALGIAVGSTLQACVASAWLRRLMPDLDLTEPRRVLRFLLIGLLSCLIAATVGNLTLLAHGYIAPSQLLQSFATWWMGDAFGVQIFAPLTFLVLAPNATWKQRRLSVGLPLLVSFMLSGVIYYFVSESDRHQLQRSFVAATDPVDNELQSLHRIHGQALAQLAAGYRVRNASPGPEFLLLAAQIQTALPSFRAISWAPVQGESASVAPVTMVYPVQGNEAALGLNLMGEERRAQAVRRAIDTGQLSMTEPLKLAQDPDGPGAVLLMAPVQGAAVHGVVSGVLDLRLIDRALQPVTGTVWELREVLPDGERLVWKSSPVQMPVFAAETHLDRAGVYRQQRLTLGGHEWHVLLHRPHSQLVAESSSSPLLVLILSLLACGVVTNFALIRTGEHERVETEVLEKTAALNAEIAERKATQAALEQSTLDAQNANLAKSQFLATMSHEIRTPMNGILGMAQLLMMDDLDEVRRKEFVRTILGSGKTLLTILNDILDLSKIEAGKLELSRSPFDAAALVEETASLFRESARAKGISVVARVAHNGARYLGDPIRLRQMLSNYVGNAIKFSSSGEVQLQVCEVESEPDGVVLEFSVQDQGIGIAHDKIAALFQPFIQVDGSATRRFGGTGLGLSIVRRLAEQMHGGVGVSSQPGVGSRFWFRVRCDRAAPRAEARHVVRASVGNSVDRSQAAHWVLVVDDNPINRMVAQAMLAKLEIVVRSANDGQEALQMLAQYQADPPSLVLMDCQMPVMDGYAATRAIRQAEADSGLPHQRIVALTAGAFDTDRALCLAAGMDDFLPKPLAFDDLVRVINERNT